MKLKSHKRAFDERRKMRSEKADDFKQKVLDAIALQDPLEVPLFHLATTSYLTSDCNTTPPRERPQRLPEMYPHPLFHHMRYF